MTLPLLIVHAWLKLAACRADGMNLEQAIQARNIWETKKILRGSSEKALLRYLCIMRSMDDEPESMISRNMSNKDDPDLYSRRRFGMNEIAQTSHSLKRKKLVFVTKGEDRRTYVGPTAKGLLACFYFIEKVPGEAILNKSGFFLEHGMPKNAHRFIVRYFHILQTTGGVKFG